MCKKHELHDNEYYGIAMALFYCCCFLSLIAVLCITFISSAKTVESDSIYIGDVLGNSSALFEVRTPTIATVDFEFDYETEIFKTNYIPPIITENLPLQHFVTSSELLDNIADSEYFNYLGRYDPIYLLAGSSIQYNVVINNTKRFNSQYVACLYLFDNDVHFDNFINSDLNSQETASHCFESNATTASYSFNIATNGLYYVGITLLGGVTIQANVSIVRKLYNITGLEQVCNYSQSCNIVICNTFICINKTTTYFLIKPTNTTDVHYTLLSSTLELHGPEIFCFIAGIALCIFCYYCCCYVFCCIICEIEWPENLKYKPPEQSYASRRYSRPVTDSASSCNNLRTFQENRGNFALYDEDLSLELYSSSVVDTNFNEEETNTSSTNLPNYWDIFNEKNSTDLNLVAELELSVLQSLEQTTSDSINDDKDHAVSSPETKSEEGLPNDATEGGVLLHDISTIDEERGHIQSSDEDASHALEPSIMPTVQSVPICEPLPSDNMEKLDERHAPAIYIAIKDIVGLWDYLGAMLGIDNADLKRIEYNNPKDVNCCVKEMILAWLRHGNHNATRYKLINVLEDIKRNDLAHKVKEL